MSDARHGGTTMMISADQRRQTEDLIHAAIDRLLNGQIPLGGACDISTLAKESGVSGVHSGAETETGPKAAALRVSSSVR